MIIGFTLYLDFPIPRFICYAKGPRQPQHRTFSLLPHWLVPYQRYSLEMMAETLRIQQQHNGNFAKTQEAIALGRKGKHDLPLENKQILGFIRIFFEAFLKLCAVPELKQQMRQTGCFAPHDPVAAILDFSARCQSPLTHHIRSTCAENLSHDFFFQWQSGDLFSRQFLFGTPSQKRGRRH